jgi:hypothetical protein
VEQGHTAFPHAGGTGARSKRPTTIRRSLLELATSLRAELPRVGTIELHACWVGDETARPVGERAVTRALFDTPS